MKITPSGYSKGTFFTIDDNKDVVYSVDAVKTAIGNKFLNDYETKIKPLQIIMQVQLEQSL